MGSRRGDAVKGHFDSSAFAGVEVYDCAKRHGDDVCTVGHGVLDALDEPAKESAGLTRGALVGEGCGTSDGSWHALEDLDVEQGGGGGDADDLSGTWTECCGSEGGGPGAVAFLILWSAIVAWAGKSGDRGLIDFADIEGEVGCEVGMSGVDSAIQNGDANTFACGGIPRAMSWTAKDTITVAADLADSPALGRLVERVERGSEGW